MLIAILSGCGDGGDRDTAETGSDVTVRAITPPKRNNAIISDINFLSWPAEESFGDLLSRAGATIAVR
jgi:hypothetical protein